MLETIMQTMKTKLQSKDNSMPVYTAFDAIPVIKKEHDGFIVLNIEECKASVPIVHDTKNYYPIKATLSVTILMPPETETAVLYQRFNKFILPEMLKTDCTFISFQTKSPSIDKLLRKQTLIALFSVNGFYEEVV